MSLHSGQNLTAGHLSDLLGGKTKASPKKRKQKETQPEETQPEVTQPEETQPEGTQPEGTQPVQPRAGAKGGNKKKKVNLALKSHGEKRIAPPSIFDDLPADAFDDSPKKTQPEETQPEETQPEETEGETIEMDVQATAVSHVQVCEVAMADVHGTSFFDGALPVSGAFDVEDLVGKYIYIPKNFFAKR